MIRKILKWIGIVLGGLIGLLVLVIAILYVVGGVMWNRVYEKYDVPIQSLNIPTDEAAVARGKHIATTHYCGFCHGENLAGGFLVNEPVLMVVPAPNLTSGMGGISATNTDDDWVRAIRHGVGHDGRGLTGMPSRIWYHLSDEDLGPLIAYLKTLTAVDNDLPSRQIGPLGRVLLVLGQIPPPEAAVIDHESARPVAPKPGITVAYGEYLARSSCSACHGASLNGGTVRGLDGEVEVALNLTPRGRLALWSEGEFLTTLRTGVTPDGHALSESMPWQYIGQMSDEELRAVWLYLQSLPPLEQNLERTDPPR